MGQSFLRSAVQRGKRLVRALLGRDVLYGRQIRVPTEAHGSRYGEWVICPHDLQADSIVYAFGVGEDVTFDCSLIERYGVTVHAFDPTPKSIEWVRTQQLPEAFLFHPFGIASFDGTATFAAPENPAHVSFSLLNRTNVPTIDAPVFRLGTIMNRLGHDHVDLLKMDIEGAEYEVLADLLDQEHDVRQVLVEFHHRFEHVGVDHTKEAVQQLNRHGYRIFYVSPSGEEYSFVRV